MLYLDATADPVITEAYLPALEHQKIDVKQRAVVSQVVDRTGSNTFWNDRIDQEKINLTSPEYDHQHNDLAATDCDLERVDQGRRKPTSGWSSRAM